MPEITIKLHEWAVYKGVGNQVIEQLKALKFVKVGGGNINKCVYSGDLPLDEVLKLANLTRDELNKHGIYLSEAEC